MLQIQGFLSQIWTLFGDEKIGLEGPKNYSIIVEYACAKSSLRSLEFEQNIWAKNKINPKDDFSSQPERGCPVIESWWGWIRWTSPLGGRTTWLGPILLCTRFPRFISNGQPYVMIKEPLSSWLLPGSTLDPNGLLAAGPHLEAAFGRLRMVWWLMSRELWLRASKCGSEMETRKCAGWKLSSAQRF